MSTYDALLAEYLAEEKRRLLGQFYQKHRSFRDSVQIPEVISVSTAILLTAFLVTAYDGVLGRVVICVLMISFCFALRRFLGWMFAGINRQKMESFLKGISESVEENVGHASPFPKP